MVCDSFELVSYSHLFIWTGVGFILVKFQKSNGFKKIGGTDGKIDSLSVRLEVGADV